MPSLQHKVVAGGGDSRVVHLPQPRMRGEEAEEDSEVKQNQGVRLVKKRTRKLFSHQPKTGGFCIDKSSAIW